MLLKRQLARVFHRGTWRLLDKRSSQTLASNSQLSENVLDLIRDITGTENVSVSEAVRLHHSKDESKFNKLVLPEAVVSPQSVAEVSECVKVCAHHRVPMIPFGTGTGLEGGVVAIQGGITFNLTQMDQVLDLSPDDFNVTVEPGVTRLGINNYLKDTGLWFPVDPGADASLCGMAATSASGTNAVRYGTMRENVINLEVVLADGQILHTSGPKMRASKTAAGYNLTNLFVGSEGTLGMITKTTLRLYGVPEMMVSAVCQFPDTQSAVDTTVMVQQAGIPVARIEFLDDVQMRACNDYSKLDYEILPTLFLEFHGEESAVQNQATAVEEMATSNGGLGFQWATETEARNKLWKARHSAFYASKALRPTAKTIVTDVCVPVSRLTEAVTRTQEDLKASGLIGPLVGHVGDGNFHATILYDPENEEEQRVAAGVASRMALRAIECGGTCTGEHGIGLGKKSYLAKEIGDVGVSVMRQLKQTLDPHNLMNPGKVLD